MHPLAHSPCTPARSVARFSGWLAAIGCALLTACGGGSGGDTGAQALVKAPVAGRSDLGGHAWSYTPRAKQSPVPAATVTGPIPVGTIGGADRNYPQLATQYDLAGNGYVEEEYFFEGTATRYSTPALTTGEAVSSGHPYRSRMIVRKPANPSRFNGVVVVEWVNVTSGYNLDALWQSSANSFMRQGYAYVGVSAQSVGIHQANTGLVSWSPTRYGTLDVTGGGAFPFSSTALRDALSYDIYAQAAKAVATPGKTDPLHGLPARRMLIAAGVSQSEGRLVSYYNSVEPLQNLFDGYYLFLGIGGTLRTDLPLKALKINTENDVLLLGEARARQADSDVLRTWEIAGTSHVSYSSGAVRTPMLLRDGLPVADASVCTRPALSRVSPGPVLNVGYVHLVDWIARDVAPPTAPRLTLTSVTPAVVARDSFGNALGGIQLPDHEVPTATNTGLNSGPGFCFLFGSHEPFGAATLQSLYPTKQAYVDAVTASVQRNVEAGFLLPEDGQRIIDAANAAAVPN